VRGAFESRPTTAWGKFLAVDAALERLAHAAEIAAPIGRRGARTVGLECRARLGQRLCVPRAVAALCPRDAWQQREPESDADARGEPHDGPAPDRRPLGVVKKSNAPAPHPRPHPLCASSRRPRGALADGSAFPRSVVPERPVAVREGLAHPGLARTLAP